MTTEANLPQLAARVMEREGLVVDEIFRPGPRYWIGRVRQRDRLLILKVLLDNTILKSPGGGRDIDPARAMETEARCFMALHRHQVSLGEPAPEVVAHELGAHAWLLRSLQPGQALAAGTGVMMFADELYTQAVTDELINYLLRIQTLKAELSGVLLPAPLKHMTSSDYLEPVSLVAPYASRAWDYLQSKFELYDAHLDTMTHGQVFAPHVYLHKGHVALIDWEDAGLRSKMHDFVAVWLRGFGRTEWQEWFLAQLSAKGYIASEQDRELWRIETVVQAYGILIYFHWSSVETPEKKQAAIDSLKEKVEAVLGGVS